MSDRREQTVHTLKRFTVPLNNMRNVKCKAQPTKAFFDTVIKWNRWTQFRQHSRKLGGTAKHLIDGSEKCFGRWALKFRVQMLLKGAVGSVHTRGNVAGTCCNEVSSCAIPVYAKNIFVLATHCKEFSWFDFVRHEARTWWPHFTNCTRYTYKWQKNDIEMNQYQSPLRVHHLAYCPYKMGTVCTDL